MHHCNRMRACTHTRSSTSLHVRSSGSSVVLASAFFSTSPISPSSTPHNHAPAPPRTPSRWTPRSTTTTTPPRRHHLDHIPSLKDFMLRADVLSLYRNVWRLTKPLDETKRAEIRLYARAQIDNVKHVRDSQQIRMQLTQGKWQLDELQKMMNMTS